MIFVIAEIEIAEGKRVEFLKAFNALVPAVHEEAGCIEYGPTVDIDSGIDAQADLRPSLVTVVEKWESVDHLKSHLVAPHMMEFRDCVLYTSPSPRDATLSRMPSSA